MPRFSGNVRQQSDQLWEEIAWLRSYRMNRFRIAAALGVTVDCVEKHYRKRGIPIVREDMAA